MWRYVFLFLGFLSSNYVFALWDYNKINSDSYKSVKFNNIGFKINTRTTTCELKSKNYMSCKLELNSNLILNIEINYNNISDPKTAGLVRLIRAKQWKSKHKNISFLSAQEIRISLGVFKIQRAWAYYHDNISYPLLLRALDVVLDKQLISMTTICGAQDFQQFLPIIQDIEQSLHRVGSGNEHIKSDEPKKKKRSNISWYHAKSAWHSTLSPNSL